MKPILIVFLFIVTLINFGCQNGSKTSNSKPKVSVVCPLLKANDSIGEMIFRTIIAKVGPGINSMMTYINDLVKKGSFTNQQLGQILNHFRANDPIVDKIINQGKKYPNQNRAKQIWSEVYSEYNKSDKNKFAKRVTEDGDVYHLIGYMKDWTSKHNGNQIADQMVGDPTIFDLEQLGRKHEALEVTRANNAKKIREAFTEKFKFSAKKLKKDGFDISKTQIDKAVSRIMNEYVSSGYDWDAIRKNADKIDKLIAGDLGVSFVKNTESKRDRSWWEYIPAVYTTEAIYDVATGNRVDVAASWINDILVF